MHVAGNFEPMETNLYHCTNYDSLEKILESKSFQPSFCIEKSTYLGKEFEFAFAMVCFADLLENELKEHISKFGDSYICMSKDWAIKKLLSPVIYYNSDSVVSSSLKHFILNVANSRNSRDSIDVKYASLLMSFCKQYEGPYYNNKTKNWDKKLTSFYTEREWRWVPMPTDREANYLDPYEFYNDRIVQEKKAELIAHGYILRFNWNDILCIGVNSAAEKKRIINILLNSFPISNEEAESKIIINH